MDKRPWQEWVLAWATIAAMLVAVVAVAFGLGMLKGWLYRH